MALLVTNKGKHYARVMGGVQHTNPTARPGAQVTMKTASKRFSTMAGFKICLRYFFSAEMPTE